MRNHTLVTYDKTDYDNVRKNMSRQEIIDLLNEIGDKRLPSYSLNGDAVDFDVYKLHIALDKAIEVLEKTEGK